MAAPTCGDGGRQSTISESGWRWLNLIGIPFLTACVVLGGWSYQLKEQRERLEKMESMLGAIQASVNQQGLKQERLASDLNSLSIRHQELNRVVEDNRIRGEQSLRVIEGMRLSGKIP